MAKFSFGFALELPFFSALVGPWAFLFCCFVGFCLFWVFLTTMLFWHWLFWGMHSWLPHHHWTSQGSPLLPCLFVSWLFINSVHAYYKTHPNSQPLSGLGPTLCLKTNKQTNFTSFFFLRRQCLWNVLLLMVSITPTHKIVFSAGYSGVLKFLFYMFEYFDCVYVYACCPQRLEEGIRSTETRVIDDFEFCGNQTWTL